MQQACHATIPAMTDPDAAPPADPLAAFLAELGRFSVDDLAMVALPEPDPDERAALLQRAVDAAHAADRREELAAAPARAREQLFRAWSRRGYEPTWFGLNWGRSLGRADDRARLVAAVEDAAVAAVVADLLSAEDVGALREPFEIATSMAGAGPVVESDRPRLAEASAPSSSSRRPWRSAPRSSTGAYVLGGALAAPGCSRSLQRRRRG